MRPRTIAAALAVSACLLVGCGSRTSHQPATLEPGVQVFTVTGATAAFGGPESPQEKQVERELRGVEGESPQRERP